MIEGYTRSPAGLRLQVEPPLARLLLDRDAKHNAVSREMLDAMTAFVEEVGADPALRVLVLAGEGRSFCAGEDVTGFDFPDVERATSFLDGPLGFFTALERLPKPVVVAVHGYALGFGSEILLVADAVFCHPQTVFGFAEIDHGAVPSVLMTRGLGVVFRRRALELALTGRRFGAEEARELRLVHEVVASPGEAAEEAARSMAGWAPTAVALIEGWLAAEATDDHDRAREFMPRVLTQLRVDR
jgi:enoyl-CoA hydratase/carnithine racemase